MTQDFSAHFDGKVLIPDEPVELPVGQSLRIRIKKDNNQTAPFDRLLDFAADLADAPSDLSVQHDHYLYGNPKR